MKTSVALTLLLACSASAAPPAQVSVPIELGPKAYRNGDAIEITEVTATSPLLEQGDSVTVTGRFYLKSQETANLSLNLTATVGDGRSLAIPEASMTVSKGHGEFTLSTLIRSTGYLHLTFYDPTTGKPFGGTYFGTPQQVKSISNWDVSYYLDSEKPSKRLSRRRDELAKLQQKVQTLEKRFEELNRKFNAIK